ncbi:MAG: hypothetical protein L0177_19380 [Chloroflexi bacterium]|nr:hypothetical protein [Chloroflexota bacterium]
MAVLTYTRNEIQQVISPISGYTTGFWNGLPGWYWAAWNDTIQPSHHVLYHIPFLLNRAVTITSILARVTAAGGAGSLIRAGFYTSSFTDGQLRPANLIFDAGEQAADSIASLTWPAPVTLPAGYNFLSYAFRNIGTTGMLRGPDVTAALSVPLSARQNPQTGSGGAFIPATLTVDPRDALPSVAPQNFSGGINGPALAVLCITNVP